MSVVPVISWGAARGGKEKLNFKRRFFPHAPRAEKDVRLPSGVCRCIGNTRVCSRKKKQNAENSSSFSTFPWSSPPLQRVDQKIRAGKKEREREDSLIPLDPQVGNNKTCKNTQLKIDTYLYWDQMKRQLFSYSGHFLQQIPVSSNLRRSHHPIFSFGEEQELSVVTRARFAKTRNGCDVHQGREKDGFRRSPTTSGLIVHHAHLLENARCASRTQLSTCTANVRSKTIETTVIMFTAMIDI